VSESAIYCEGYHDRAFWSGWLTYLGCTDPGIVPNLSERAPVRDPWNEKVAGGQYAYRSKSQQFIRVVPSHGKDKLVPLVLKRLENRYAKPLSRVVINVDPDTTPGGTTTGLKLQDILVSVQRVDPSAVMDANGEIAMDGGATKIALVRWESGDGPLPGVPNQQTLERLVCAALVAAYPERGPCVQSWLDTLDPPPVNVKAFAWSFMAGWHAEHGCDDFYRCLWDDAKVRGELETRLRASGVWQIAEALAS